METNQNYDPAQRRDPARTGAHQHASLHNVAPPKPEDLASDYSALDPAVENRAAHDQFRQSEKPTRPSAPLHDDTRLDALEHDVARTDALGRADAQPEDAEVHAQTEAETNRFAEPSVDDRHTNETKQPATPGADWMELGEALAEFKRRGYPRKLRTIQSYCQRGKLNCNLTPAENGARYLVERRSIERFIEQQVHTLPSSLSAPTEEPSDISFANPTSSFNSKPDGEPIQSKHSDGAHHFGQVVELKDQLIESLQEQVKFANNQLTVKDNQIEAMLERDRETNILIRNQQTLMGLPDPDSRKPSTPSDVNDQ